MNFRYRFNIGGPTLQANDEHDNHAVDRLPLVRTSEFYYGLVGTFLALLLVKWIFPNLLPFEIFQFWTVSFDWQKILSIPWWLLLVGPVLVIVYSIVTRNSRMDNIRILEDFKEDFKTSVLAGIFEEVSFRWLSFYWAIVALGASTWFVTQVVETSDLWKQCVEYWFLSLIVLVILNFIGAGALALVKDNDTGCLVKLIGIAIGLTVFVLDIILIIVIMWHIGYWLYNLVMIPIVNFISQGQLDIWLYNYGWIVGASLISVNWSFGSGHVNNCLLSFIDAWIFGLIMFWITFNFGLPLAIAMHVVYKVLLHMIRVVDSLVELNQEAR